MLTSPKRRFLDAVLNEARATDVTLWLVGGAVRDLVLGRPVHDLDIAIEGDAGAFAASVAARTPDATVESEPRFGTASIRLAGARLDFARLRRERYASPGALPRVTFGVAIEDDLARRDFSVNAMALGLAGPDAGTLVDPFGGLDDLPHRRLRVLLNRSFEDDATRLWRGARTAAVFDLAPEPETARLIVEGTRYLDTISGDRLTAEIAFTAARGRAGRTLALAEAWGVLRAIHPSFRLDPMSERALRRRPRPMPVEVLLAVLLAPLREREAIAKRLNISRALARCVEQTATLLDAGRAGDAPPERLAPLVGASEEARLAARWLDAEGQRTLQRDLRRWERTQPAIDAGELMRLGMPRGPGLGAALEGLRRARYLGMLVTPADARREAQRMVAAAASRAPRTR